MNIEPLTAAIYARFNGGAPLVTIRGVAATYDSEVYGICGVVVAANKSLIVFGEKQGLTKRGIIKGWRELEKSLDRSKTYYAVADNEANTSKSMLEHFNFSRLTDELYMYEGK